MDNNVPNEIPPTLEQQTQQPEERKTFSSRRYLFFAVVFLVMLILGIGSIFAFYINTSNERGGGESSQKEPPIIRDESGDTIEFVEYESSMGFSIKHPSGWNVLESKGVDTYAGGVVITGDSQFQELNLTGGQSRASLSQSDSAYIIVDLFLAPISGKEQLEQIFNEEVLKGNAEDVHIRPIEDVSIINSTIEGNNPFVLYEYKQPNLKKRGITKFLFILKEEVVFYPMAAMISYVAPEDQYSKDVAEFILGSFEEDYYATQERNRYPYKDVRDSSECKDIPEGEDKYECLLYAGYNSLDTASCELIPSSKEQKDNENKKHYYWSACYQAIAIETRDVTFCDGLADPPLSHSVSRVSCYESVAAHSEPPMPEACLELPQDRHFRCYEKIAVQANDVQYCQKMKEDLDMTIQYAENAYYECFVELASRNGDIAYCDYIDDQEYRETYCEQYFK